jgi:hypothetical protein
MRQIQFRAWNPVLNKMTQEFHITGMGVVWHSTDNPDENYSEAIDWYIMQDIGKSDIKGNLIFDQDIVRIKYPNGGDFANTIGRVFWDEDECNFYHGNSTGRPPKRMWEYAEVIGNVFETPKLWERIKKTL